MKKDIYGQFIYNENDLCELLLKNPEIKFKYILTEEKIEIPDDLFIGDVPTIVEYSEPNQSYTDFDRKKQSKWFMPDEYKSLDIAKYVLDQCKTEEELQRAGQELLMYQERDMFDLLRYLKYLIDTMRKYNIVWGVGRGSSVASFVLFLIGVHKVNSLYYDLSIDEFLK